MSRETQWIRAVDPFTASWVVEVQGLREPHRQVLDRRGLVVDEVKALIETLAIPTEPSSEPLRIVITLPRPVSPVTHDQVAEWIQGHADVHLMPYQRAHLDHFYGPQSAGDTAAPRQSLAARTRLFVARLFRGDPE